MTYGFTAGSDASDPQPAPAPAAAAAASNSRARPEQLDLGEVVATPGVIGAIADDQEAATRLLATTILPRFASRDWGEVSEHDRAANDAALVDGDRVLAVYVLRSVLFSPRIYVIREPVSADGKFRTTVLLPDEY